MNLIPLFTDMFLTNFNGFQRESMAKYFAFVMVEMNMTMKLFLQSQKNLFLLKII